MAIPNIFRTGISGMMASKTAVATTGHNISNANTEGYSRQRVQQETTNPQVGSGRNILGTGVQPARTERVNDEYLEKHIRNGVRDLSNFEEKDTALRQIEDIFNEMNGEGLNRLMSRFFNEFRKLSNEPDSEAVRQSVREASQAIVNDFHRLRNEVVEVRKHIDSRIEGYSKEINTVTEEIRDLNIKIQQTEATGVSPNDLLDKRDKALKNLATYMDIAAHKDNRGHYSVDIKGVGPLVTGPNAEKFSVERTPADQDGKGENSVDLKTTASAHENVTHGLKGGKLGALLEVRDQMLTTILDRLDTMAYSLSEAVNDVHAEGYTRTGQKGIAFFAPMNGKERAAELLQLSDEVRTNINNIATAAIPDAPGDNRIALAIAGLQDHRILNDGRANFDEFYNSIVSDVGVATQRNKAGISQQKDIMTQLNKMRDQISGVSIDEETANLLQFQQTYGASAKVIQVADEMLKTVLDLKR